MRSGQAPALILRSDTSVVCSVWTHLSPLCCLGPVSVQPPLGPANFWVLAGIASQAAISSRLFAPRSRRSQLLYLFDANKQMVPRSLTLTAEPISRANLPLGLQKAFPSTESWRSFTAFRLYFRCDTFKIPF